MQLILSAEETKETLKGNIVPHYALEITLEITGKLPS